jgi:quercetin dioxygenase-like cupin family protein
MSFHTPSERAPKEIFPGALSRTYWGDKLLLSLLELAPGCVVPRHSHPHEQAGICLEGVMEFTIGDETRLVQPGEMFIIPGGVEHSVRVLDQPVKALDIFSPVREEYKW